MCTTCTNLMNDVRMRQVVCAAYESGQEKVLTAHNAIVDNLKQEILVELKNEIKTNFSVLINSSSMTPRTSKHTAPNVATSRRRRLFAKPSANKQHTQALLPGTSESLSPSLGNFAAAPSQKFWLYLSRISRDVTTEQVRALASRRLGTDAIDVVRLVGKGRDINTLSFISFKIGFDASFKAQALSSSTWPKGIYYREFQDNRNSTNFWKPQLTTDHNSIAARNLTSGALSTLNDSDMMDTGHRDAH